jgi:hypothetical protein
MEVYGLQFLPTFATAEIGCLTRTMGTCCCCCLVLLLLLLGAQLGWWVDDGTSTVLLGSMRTVGTPPDGRIYHIGYPLYSAALLQRLPGIDRSFKDHEKGTHDCLNT